MKIEQIYTGCLAQGAYYIESDNEAIVIDPLREVMPYILRAENNHARIKYVFETHFHADFVSGHLDLAHKTGATIVYGPTAEPCFAAHIAKDNEELAVGRVIFKVLHTPGHTMESVCYLLRDENGKDTALFSGDTLFIGDVGRPDLAQKAAHKTKEELAGMLYDSLRNKVMPLDNDIVVYPAHGAGSACGKSIRKETSDTLGHQKATNYALRANMTRDEFIQEVMTGLLPPPAYFSLDVMLNKQGYESIDEVMKRGNTGLNPDAFESAANETGALVLDTRNAQTFAKAFVPSSINIGIDGNFAPWVGALIPGITQRILIVDEPGREEEVITRLARVGYDYTVGFLTGGIEAWQKEGKVTDGIRCISAEELAGLIRADAGVIILDVRTPAEYEDGHIENAVNAPLDFINDSMRQINKNSTCYVHCNSGYRSMIFISILKARGYHHLVNIDGGFDAIKTNGRIKISDHILPTIKTNI